MKRMYLLFILTASCCINGAAQKDNYVPLVREGVRWIYLYYDNPYTYMNEGEGLGEQAYYFEFKGDTTIMGKEWKKLYCGFDINSPISPTLKPIAFMRESDKHVSLIMNEEGRDQYENHHFTPAFGLLETVGHCSAETMNSQAPYFIYDFDDIATTIAKHFEPWSQIPTFVGKNVEYGGSTHKSYLLSTGQSLIEGIGFVGNETGDLLCPFPDYCTCEASERRGLIKVIDGEGKTLYLGDAFYSAYQPSGREDVSDVSRLIDEVLGIQPVWKLSKTDINADNCVDISDVNALIDYILGK